jgi:hypothetical protein
LHTKQAENQLGKATQIWLNSLKRIESPRETQLVDIDKGPVVLVICLRDGSKACPWKTLKPGFKPVKWWSTELSLQESRRLYRLCLSRAPEDWCHYISSQKSFKAAMRKAKRESWKQFSESIKDIPKLQERKKF